VTFSLPPAYEKGWHGRLVYSERDGLYRAGYASKTTSVVEQITGRKPILFAEFAKDYVEAFR
jgi:hypothetical protein